jgi:hypothetical protein
VYYEGLTTQVSGLLPQGPRLAVIGSTSFWHPESEATCIAIGQSLARIFELNVLTGGVSGVGEAVGRSFFDASSQSPGSRGVFHVLPEGEAAWDYGETLFAGLDMGERREVLGRLAPLYIVVEGGPGTAHEAAVALSRDAILIPVGKSGGHAAEVYTRVSQPAAVPPHSWLRLGQLAATPQEIADAVHDCVCACLDLGDTC